MKNNILFFILILSILLGLSFCESKKNDPQPDAAAAKANEDSLFKISIKPSTGVYRDVDSTNSVTIQKGSDTTISLSYVANIDSIKNRIYVDYIYGSLTIVKTKGELTDNRGQITWPFDGGTLTYDLNKTRFLISIKDNYQNVYGNKLLYYKNL